MRTRLSFSETLSAILIAGFLSGPPAFAAMSDYTTDMEEPDIMTVKNDHCCNNNKLREEANVQIEVQHPLLARIKPVNIQVMDESNQVVANFSTRNRIIYMHLPEGKYTLKSNGILDHNTVNVKASDEVLKNFVL